MGGTNDRPEENDTTRQNQEIGMTPDQIQELIEIKRNLELQVVDLNNQKNYLQQQLNIYQQNAFNMHGQYQNLNAQAKFNNIQASQQIAILQNQNSTLRQEKYNLNLLVNKLRGENEQYKFYNNKLQLMLLNNMQNKKVNDNINSWQKMNNANNNNMNNNININNAEFIGKINPEIKRACLKLFKCQIKFLNKAWRQENENILTDIYLNLNVSCDQSDNYLKYKDIKDKDLIKEINPLYFKEDELKNIFSEFHDYNYFHYTTDPSSYDDFLNKKYHSLYANILLSLENQINETK